MSPSSVINYNCPIFRSSEKTNKEHVKTLETCLSIFTDWIIFTYHLNCLYWLLIKWVNLLLIFYLKLWLRQRQSYYEVKRSTVLSWERDLQHNDALFSRFHCHFSGIGEDFWEQCSDSDFDEQLHGFER